MNPLEHPRVLISSFLASGDVFSVTDESPEIFIIRTITMMLVGGDASDVGNAQVDVGGITVASLALILAPAQGTQGEIVPGLYIPVLPGTAVEAQCYGGASYSASIGVYGTVQGLS